MMIKSLPKTSHQLAVCEANFLRLKKYFKIFLEINIHLKQLIQTLLQIQCLFV